MVGAKCIDPSAKMIMISGAKILSGKLCMVNATDRVFATDSASKTIICTMHLVT